jgi:two-component system sensor histidine kinase UhpB
MNFQKVFKGWLGALWPDPAPAWIRYAGWGVVAIATVLLGAAPDLLRPTAPADAIVLDHARYQTGGDDEKEVSLPHAIFFGLQGRPTTATYRIDFELKTAPEDGLYLLIPVLNRRISLSLNGEALFDSGSRTIWSGPLVSSADYAQLPGRTLRVGINRLTVEVEVGNSVVPTYLSQIYLGNRAALEPRFKLLFFVGQQLNSMGFGAHILMGVGLVLAFFMRRQDSMFAWLIAAELTSLYGAIGNYAGFQPYFVNLLPFFIALVPAGALLTVGVALSVVNVRPPAWLRNTIIAVAAIALTCAFINTPLSKTIMASSAIAIYLLSSVAGLGIYAWGAIWRNNIDAKLMLMPASLFAWFLIRDAYVAATLPEYPFNLLIPYGRVFYIAAITAILMRRMGASLDQLDRANETLNHKLAEREAQLAILSRQERIEATRVTRERERQRLTYDLHDGLSGHLASIIALSERSGEKPTELAARDALSDLRLVIYSLDLGDSELPLALANFRERLIPQLHRLGVELDWSIAGLPEVTGVTPGNALVVLRIIQEAITNALKHGPARRIAIRGTPSADGGVAITVENDGRAFVETKGGHGLANMRRRAAQLSGKLNIEALDLGTKLSLFFPSHLPAFEDEAAASHPN